MLVASSAGAQICRRPPSRAPLGFTLLAVALGLLVPPAQGASLSPGRFVVRGKPLVTAKGVNDGHSVSVFAKPVAVTVDGCSTRTPSVRVKGGLARVAAQLLCPGIHGHVRLTATVRHTTMSGRVSIGSLHRSFVARLAHVAGTLLRGRPKAAAVPTIRNGDAIVRHPAGEVSVSHGVKVLRTELLIELSSRATIGQVNAALALVGGRIVGSFARSPLITVAIPDPGSLATLDAVIRLLVHRPGVAGADRSTIPKPDDLPNGFSTPLGDGPGALALHQLLALRMPAAWNASKAMQLAQRPLLLIDDFFGNGVPDTHVDATLSNPAGFLTGAPDEDAHGYHVLGIAAGNHDSDGSSAGLVTGVFPAATNLDVVDLTGSVSVSDDIALLRDEVLAKAQAEPHVVINTSLGFGGGISNHEVRLIGSEWLNFIRDNGLEDSVLQATSAGNDSTTSSLQSARDNSTWTAATLRPDLLDSNGHRTTGLTNTLVVESNADSGAPAFNPGCRSSYSDLGGTISAFGDDVYSNLLGSDAGLLSGTSMATPEIAALAEYLWTIAPNLTAPEVVGAIQSNVSALQGCQDRPAADAYSATLSLDRPGCFTPTCAPVRFAILDQNHDGRFDEADVSAFADHIFADPAKTDRDWSQYDLNGDGFTGGDSTAPFDLDTTGSTRAGIPQLGTVTQTVHDINGNPAPLQFDEQHVTDADVLCYYAYSSFYTPAATDDQRDAILGNHCQPPVLVTACGTEGDSSTDVTLGSNTQSFQKGPGPNGSTSSISIPHCSPPMNAVFPENKAQLTAGTGCGTLGKSACNSVATASGTMTASGSLGGHGGTIQISAVGALSGSIVPAPSAVSSAGVSADSGISFKVNRACQYTATGTVTSSTSGGGTVSFRQLTFRDSTGTLMDASTGSGSANGTLQPGTYSLGGSAQLHGNTDPSTPSFAASANLSGSVNLTC